MESFQTKVYLLVSHNFRLFKRATCISFRFRKSDIVDECSLCIAAVFPPVQWRPCRSTPMSSIGLCLKRNSGATIGKIESYESYSPM
ncbi:hypothetical protein Hypma_002706 [Hypsizygus marmoreus]|uniref:Uncharacterized protein n=1 Tax=Hypsizygus marmoreus TaxID=39966 RepID=A0A369J5U8_HYPMA|nr:hypothetical protein Hypma_002706 [Hypsizygus marmoreus]